MKPTAQLSAALALTLIAGVAHAQKFAMRPSQRTLAAVGTIELDLQKSGNHEVKIEVDHLPLPQQLNPSATTYVVWFRTGDDDVPMPMGTIRLEDDRRGSLELKTPLKLFEVLVTAEATGAPSRPSSLVVLRGKADGNRKKR